MSAFLIGLLVTVFSFFGSLIHHEYQVYQESHKKAKVAIAKYDKQQMDLAITTTDTTRDGVQSL